MSLFYSYDFANPTSTEQVLEVVGGQGAFSFDIISKNIDVADANVSFFFSNNKVDYIAIPVSSTENASFDIPTGNDVSALNITDIDHRYYKMVLTVGSSTVGTIEIHTKQ